MEKVEAKHRADVAAERERQVAKARLATATKFNRRAEQAESKEKNILRFREDRDSAEERAKRVIAAIARDAALDQAGSSKSGNNPLTRHVNLGGGGGGGGGGGPNEDADKNKKQL